MTEDEAGDNKYSLAWLGDTQMVDALERGDTAEAARLGEQTLPQAPSAFGIEGEFIFHWPALVMAALANSDSGLADRLMERVTTTQAALPPYLDPQRLRQDSSAQPAASAWSQSPPDRDPSRAAPGTGRHGRGTTPPPAGWRPEARGRPLDTDGRGCGIRWTVSRAERSGAHWDQIRASGASVSPGMVTKSQWTPVQLNEGTSVAVTGGCGRRPNGYSALARSRPRGDDGPGTGVPGED